MGKRFILGVILADSHVGFQAEILRGLISQAFRANCDLAIIAPMHNFSVDSIHKNTEKQLFDLIFSDSTDGIIYGRNTFPNEAIRTYIDDLCKRSGKPVMLLDSEEHKNFETTSVDDCEAFETITDHLIEVHGKRKIYCLTGPKNIFSAEQRLQGYLHSLKKHGIKAEKHWHEYGDFWHDAALDMAKRIVNGTLEKPDAVVCGNDISAIYLCSGLMAGGLRVPEDIAVTGYDASEEGHTATPSITGYNRPNFQLGAEAVRRLYRIITGKICRKVHTENGSLCLGQSCGCTPVQPAKKQTRAAVVNERYEKYLLYGDMLFDISSTGSIGAFADRLDNHLFYLARMQRMRVCLTEDYIASTASSAGDPSEKLSFSHNSTMQVILAKSSGGREYDKNVTFSADKLLPDFHEKRNYPSAYFISPLHYNDNFFGYSAVSFGKAAITYPSLYIQWINYVNVALEQMRIRSILNNTAIFADKALTHDSMTGLLNRSGAEEKFAAQLREFPDNSAVTECIAIEVHGLNKAYYKDGEEKSNRIAAEFAEVLKKCTAPDEITAVWSSRIFCIISFSGSRAETVYKDICRYIGKGALAETDFTVGTYTQKMTSPKELAGCIYQASIERMYTYNISDRSGAPRFDELCRLRGQMRKNPEKPWNISKIADELYLSKSYLQKIYKTYFNKSIIEELIEFRLEKAKGLLSETDMKIIEIAEECGYSSYNYFVRQFRNAEGVSPTEYREAKEAEKDEG
ncbi:MAG: substrate-binding domain-containing protein [Ruminococcus sp.]|nr:substrate-binding domain-containing protein [Ruminococcus sp.]